MAAPHPARVVTLAHTAHLEQRDLDEARALMDDSFGNYTDADWSHALGGMHAIVRVDGVLVAHGSLAQRRLLVGEGPDAVSLRCGWIESVATRADHQRRGHASAVMDALESLAAAYDLLGLSASDAGAALYRGRGWVPWRGPTSVLSPDGRVRTPEEDGTTHVLLESVLGQPLDIDAPLACEWRDGDVW